MGLEYIYNILYMKKCKIQQKFVRKNVKINKSSYEKMLFSLELWYKMRDKMKKMR